MAPDLTAIDEHPASDSVIEAIAQDLADMRTHPDDRLFCFHRTVEVGEHMASVLARLRDTEAELARLRDVVKAVSDDARQRGEDMFTARDNVRARDWGKARGLERGANELTDLAKRLRAALTESLLATQDRAPEARP
ncbi:hypothetical protein [Actinomadura sp. K4S16]|uniref:hypothetical protein n=1 Tax=Actinomadura sp. K4S16 TaxID=1316147 RepID=UPI0011EC916A|nr:hypothetical protein [Actinomadura sp. K4S16]